MHRFQSHHDLGRVGPRRGLRKPPARPEVPEELAAADELEREKDVGRVLFFDFVFVVFGDAYEVFSRGFCKLAREEERGTKKGREKE